MPALLSHPARRSPVLALLMALPLLVFAADDVRVPQLEQDMRELQRTVRQQARRIDELERELARHVASGPPATSRKDAAKASASDQWLDPERWDRVRAEMSAQEVIAILGLPASMRTVEGSGTRILLYATQIGSTGFLSGSVTLENDRVRDVSRPVLR